MTPRHVTSSSVVSTLTAPVVRVMELGADGKIIASIIGVVGAITGDLTVLLMGILILSGGLDWFLGRATAKRRGDFDTRISEAGLQSKIAGLLLVGLLRLLELVLAQAGVPDPHGVLAVVTAAALVYQDLDSIDHHRQELGGQPIPVLTAVLGIGRRLAESLLPVDPPETEEDG